MALDGYIAAERALAAKVRRTLTKAGFERCKWAKNDRIKDMSNCYRAGWKVSSRSPRACSVRVCGAFADRREVETLIPAYMEALEAAGFEVKAMPTGLDVYPKEGGGR